MKEKVKRGKRESDKRKRDMIVRMDERKWRQINSKRNDRENKEQ